MGTLLSVSFENFYYGNLAPLPDFHNRCACTPLKPKQIFSLKEVLKIFVSEKIFFRSDKINLSSEKINFYSEKIHGYTNQKNRAIFQYIN